MARRNYALNTFLLLFLAVSAVVILVPFLWMVSVSFRPDDQVLRFPPTIIGGRYTLDIYPEFLQRYHFGRIFMNSVIISIFPAVIGTLTSAMAGFAFAKYKFPGRTAIFTSLMATLMIPIFVILVPLYIMFLNIGWLSTYRAMIVPFLASPLGIFLMRQFIYSVPNDLIYAARIDGCSEYGIFSRIVLPSILPALGSLVLIIFVQRWDDLLWPAIITNTEKTKVLTVKLNQISRENNASTNWNLTMVGATLSTAPLVILFLFMQRFFISSITMTGIKD